MAKVGTGVYITKNFVHAVSVSGSFNKPTIIDCIRTERSIPPDEIYSSKEELNKRIVEAIKSYIQAQNEDLFYSQFDKSCKEAKAMIDGEMEENSLSGLIDELEADSHS